MKLGLIQRHETEVEAREETGHAEEDDTDDDHDPEGHEQLGHGDDHVLVVTLVNKLSVRVLCCQANVIGFTILIIQTHDLNSSVAFSAKVILNNVKHFTLMMTLSSNTLAVSALGVVGRGELDLRHRVQVASDQEHLESLPFQNRNRSTIIVYGGISVVQK